MPSNVFKGLSFAIRKDSKKLASKILQDPGTLFTDDYLQDYVLLLQALQRRRKEIIELLLNHNCRVKRDEKSEHPAKSFFCTPLYYAVKLGDVKIISLLLDKGALIDDRDRNKETALFLAFRLKRFNIVKELLSKYYHKLQRNKHSRSDAFTAYFIACLTKNESAMVNFIEKGICVNDLKNNFYWFNKNLKLHFAVENEYIELVEVLSKSEVDITQRNASGLTPLHLALLNFTQNRIHKSSCQKMMDYMLQLHDEKTENCYDTNGISHFHIACMRNNTELIQIFLNQGVDIDKAIPAESSILSNYTPLHIAVDFHCYSVISLLLSNNVYVDAVDDEGYSPLHLLFEIYLRKDNESIEKIIDQMLSKDREEYKNLVNVYGLSYFHIACSRNNLKLIDIFLKNEVNIEEHISLESTISAGYTPLHFAVQYNNVEAVKLLLDHNANVNTRNAEGLTPLHLAWRRKHRYINREKTDSIIDLLLLGHKDTSENSVDNNGLSHFHIACTRNNPEVVKDFLKRGVFIDKKVTFNSKDLRNCTPLHCAVKYNRVEIVRILLLHGADVNAVSRLGWTPLRAACDLSYNKTYELLKNEISVYQKYEETMCQEFIENYGVVKDKNGWKKNQTDQIEIIYLLLKHGSDKNIKDRFNEPLLIQTYRKSKFQKISGVILNHLSRRVYLHINEVFMREFLSRRKEIVKLFLRHNVNVDLRSENDQSILHVLANDTYDDSNIELTDYILSGGANVDVKTVNGLTPLHIAVAIPQCNLIKILLKYNADIDCKCLENALTPLHLACQHFVEKPKTYDKIITWLVNKGADVNARDLDGMTPLFYACRADVPAAFILLDFGADINIEKNDGTTIIEHFWNRSPQNTAADILKNYQYVTLIKNHLYKLMEIGFPVNPKLTSWYSRLIGNSFSAPSYQSENCRTEISKMKSIKIDNYTSLYDLIFKDLNRMAAYAENETFLSIMESVEFEKDLSLYNYLLKNQYRKGLLRASLLKPAKSILSKLLEVRLPDLCIDNILKYFSNRELKEFLELDPENAKN